MNLHERFKKHEEEATQLSKEIFRAVRISNTKFAICFFDHSIRTIRTSVIDSRNAHEIKLLSEMDGVEMIKYGEFLSDIQAWCDSDNPAAFPIEINEVDEASYRTLIDATVIQD